MYFSDLQQAVFARANSGFNFGGGGRGAFGLNAGASSAAGDLQTVTPSLVQNAEFASRRILFPKELKLRFSGAEIGAGGW